MGLTRLLQRTTGRDLIFGPEANQAQRPEPEARYSSRPQLLQLLSGLGTW